MEKCRQIFVIPNSKRWLNLQDLPNEEWRFIKETKKCYMISNYTRIKSMKRNTAHERILKTRIGKDCPFSKKIIQKTLDDELIKVWDSMSDVKRELNIPVPHLVRVCKGTRKSTRGFKWCYFEDSGVMNNG